MRQRYFFTVLILSILTATAGAQLCGPYHSETGFTDMNWGLADADLRYWSCDGADWLCISDSTTGGNGTYYMVSETTENGITTKTFQDYTPSDNQDYTPQITLDSQGSVLSIISTDEDNNSWEHEL